MKGRHALSNGVFIFFIFFLFTISSAHAYIDPGTGSFIIQMLIAGAVSSLVFMKMFWIKIKSFFKKIFLKGKAEDEDDQD